VFLVGEMLLGVPWGVFQGITLPYVSDITPLKLKGPATTMINIFWLIGQLSAAGVMIGTSTIKNVEWSIKAPMIIQYSWLIPLMFVALLAPESPLYLSRNNRDGLAKETLRRLNKDPLFNAEGSLAVIHAVNRHEEQTSADMGIRGCFRGMNLRRTEIALITYVTQQWVGTPLMSYSLKLLQKGGLTESHSLALTIGMYFLCIISTLCSMAAMRSVGRRKLWMGGLIAEIACLVSIGSMSFFLEKQPRMSWSIAACLLCFGAIYNFTIGPVCYTIVAETPATRLKAATNSVARGTYIIFAITNLFLVPNLLEDRPTGWGLGAKSAFVWACTATVCLIWAYFRLPEMKDLSPAQVDILFEKGVPARSWSTAVVPVA
jgi:SP family general alpha glucoside:H+ symporter-like MFS transporter